MPDAVSELSPRDVDGFIAYEALFARLRRALRHGRRDTWVGDSPDRAEIEELVGHDSEAIEVLFEESIAGVVERHVSDERLRTALHGQGIIGTNAGPRDPGTAAVHLMHSSGTLEGQPGAWGYVIGGMGRVSFALAEAAEEFGAVLACGVTVASVVPGEGVRLDGGEMIRTATDRVQCRPEENAFAPGRRSALRMGRARGRVANRQSRREGELRARPSADIHRQFAGRRCRTVRWSRSPPVSTPPKRRSNRAFSENRPHTGVRSTSTPLTTPRSRLPDHHAMSVFAQYAPYELATGSWSTRREEIGDDVIRQVARFAPDITDCVVYREVLGPPDIEAKIGSTGGHIFHGDCLPEQLWAKRFAPRTPVDGVYLCSASTHPGGSVIAINGRNAAMARTVGPRQ